MMMVLITGDLEEEHLAGRLSTREGVAFLCDEHDKGIKVKNAYDDLKRFNPSCAPWMGSLSYMDNEQSPALQAADLLAARCKDGLIEEATKGLNKQQLGEMLRNRLGDSVFFRIFDTQSLKMLVDANLLRNRKPSIGSTQQLSMVQRLIREEKWQQRKVSLKFDNSLTRQSAC